MKTDGQVAGIIEDTFTTAENLVEAVETHDDLTEIDGIGPATAGVIEDWWEVRFERERAMTNSDVVKTSSRAASIHFYNSWADALGMNE